MLFFQTSSQRFSEGSATRSSNLLNDFQKVLKNRTETLSLLYETLVRGSPLKNDGYETICFVKLTIDISIRRNSSSLRIFVINSLPHLLIAFFSSSSIVLFEMILLKCQICKVNRSMTKSVKSTDWSPSLTGYEVLKRFIICNRVKCHYC